MPQSLGAPSFGSLAGAAGSLTTGTWYVKVTALNVFGESLPSAESSVNSASGFSLTITAIPGATSYRVYYGTSSGGQNQFQTVTSLTPTITTVGTGGAPPQRSTAWLPDTDGQLIGAFDFYDWLNEALKVAARITGGIADTTGIHTNTTQVIYSIDGQWLKITNAWFDGWPLYLGGKRDTFQRSRVPGIPGQIVPFKQNDVQYFEYWPLPNRTGLVTTLNGGIGATDTTITLNSVAGLLDHGLIKVDSETIEYGAISGLNLVSCTRGLGGTTAVAHSNSAPVLELNSRIDGYRMPELYTVGSALSTITVPAAWESMLPTYILSKFRETEQDAGGAARLRQTFEQELSQWMKSTKPVAGPQQMGMRSGVETLPGYGSMGGGIIIP